MQRALEGINVLDFGWIVAGPLGTKVLGENGARVVRVESKHRPDYARSTVLFANGVGINRSAFFAAYNNDKCSITVNMGHPKARAIAERLVRWADIVVENFTPGTLERWRLGYEDLRAINAGVILIRSSLFGQEGPYAQQAGFGTTMQAQAGFTRLVGWPDRPPVGAQVPYPDFIGPWYVVTLAMAALDHRRATGEGQCIDLSQMEAGLHFMAPLILDTVANDRVLPVTGNRHPAAVPHGVFSI